MTRDTFRTLYTYNDWANDRLIQMLYRAFGEETDLRQTGDARPLAIQETATHIVAAQTIWRLRWQGHSPTTMLNPIEYPTPRMLQMAFDAERSRFWAFFDTLSSEAALDRVIHSTNTQGEPRIFPLRQMMEHVLTHSIYHRGQITARLLDLGHEAVLLSTDLIAYYHERQS